MFERPSRQRHIRLITTRSPAFQLATRAARRGQTTADGRWLSPHGKKRYICDTIEDGTWAGQRCFLIGGGPSLDGFDFGRLRGERTIAVNRSFEHVPEADIMYSMDNRFYRWVVSGSIGRAVRDAYYGFRGIRCWLDLANYHYGPEVHYVRGHLQEIFPTTLRRGIYSGTNSGYGALMLAYCLGASPIYLLGYDMRHGNGRTHFHGGYPFKQAERTLDRFRVHFGRLAPKLRAAGFEVVNLNPASRLGCFPFARPEEVL